MSKITEIEAMIKNTNNLKGTTQDLSFSYRNALGAYMSINTDNHASLKLHRIPDKMFHSLVDALGEFAYVTNHNTDTHSFSTLSLYINGVSIQFFGPEISNEKEVVENQLELFSE